jgi:hypothetical protein
MFLVKANTVIQVEAPKSKQYFYTVGWRPFTTKEDKVYEKEEVVDALRINQGYETFPDWIRQNVVEFGKVVLMKDGKYALVNPGDVTYLD